MSAFDGLSTPTKKRGRDLIEKTPDVSPESDKGKGRAKDKEVEYDEYDVGPAIPRMRGKQPIKAPASIKQPAPAVAMTAASATRTPGATGLSSIGIDQGTPAYATAVTLTGKLFNALCGRLMRVYNGEVSCAYRFSESTATPGGYMFSKYLSHSERDIQPLSLKGVEGPARLTKIARHALDNVLMGASVASDRTLSAYIPPHTGASADSSDVSVVYIEVNPMVIVDHGAFSGSSSFYQSRGVLLGALELASEDRAFVAKFVEPLVDHLVNEGLKVSKFVCASVALACTPVVSKYKRGTLSDPEHVQKLGRFLDETSLWGGCVEPPAPLYFTKADGADTAKTDVQHSSIIRRHRIPYYEATLSSASRRSMHAASAFISSEFVKAIWDRLVDSLSADNQRLDWVDKRSGLFFALSFGFFSFKSNRHRDLSELRQSVQRLGVSRRRNVASSFNLGLWRALDASVLFLRSAPFPFFRLAKLFIHTNGVALRSRCGEHAGVPPRYLDDAQAFRLGPSGQILRNLFGVRVEVACVFDQRFRVMRPFPSVYMEDFEDELVPDGRLDHTWRVVSRKSYMDGSDLFGYAPQIMKWLTLPNKTQRKKIEQGMLEDADKPSADRTAMIQRDRPPQTPVGITKYPLDLKRFSRALYMLRIVNMDFILSASMAGLIPTMSPDATRTKEVVERISYVTTRSGAVSSDNLDGICGIISTAGYNVHDFPIKLLDDMGIWRKKAVDNSPRALLMGRRVSFKVAGRSGGHTAAFETSSIILRAIREELMWVCGQSSEDMDSIYFDQSDSEAAEVGRKPGALMLLFNDGILARAPMVKNPRPSHETHKVSKAGIFFRSGRVFIQADRFDSSRTMSGNLVRIVSSHTSSPEHADVQLRSGTTRLKFFPPSVQFSSSGRSYDFDAVERSYEGCVDPIFTESTAASSSSSASSSSAAP